MPGIDAVPPAHRARAEEIVARCMDRPDAYLAYGGKRLRFDRRFISVPLGQRFRLVFEDRHGRLRIIGVMTHSRYNRFIGTHRA